jgi:DNA polymerase III subunit delta
MPTLREDQFQSFLTRSLPKASGLLIYGDDESGVDELARSALRSATKGDTSAITRLSPSDLSDDPGRLMDEVQAMSLLGDARAVLLEGAGDQQLKLVEPILALGRTQNFLVVTAGSLNKGSKLRAAFEVAENFFCLPLYEAKGEVLEQRVSALLAKYDQRFADGAAETFFSLVGDDRSEVMREAEKLSLYAHGEGIITSEHVTAVCGDIAAFSSDELIDAIFSGDLAAADQALQAQDRDASSQRPVLNSLLAHVARLQDLRFDMARGMTADAAVAAAKPMIFFGRRRAMTEHLRRLESGPLNEIQDTLSAALLQSRKLPDLADAVISRTILNVAWRVNRERRG